VNRLFAERSRPIYLFAAVVVVWLVALPFGSSGYTVGVVGRILTFGLSPASTSSSASPVCRPSVTEPSSGSAPTPPRSWRRT
jgi:hypothetical protein